MLTARGKVFADVIKDICWTKGWGTTGISKMDANDIDEELFCDDLELSHIIERKIDNIV